MDDQHDSARLSGGNHPAPVAAGETWLPYAEALALTQKICGPSYPPTAALSVLRRAFEVWASATGRGRNPAEKGAAARFPKKFVLRHLRAAAARFYDHPTSFPPITEEQWQEESEEDRFTSWLPSIEAALGGDPADWRQPRGEPWTAENTEWRLDTLRAALADPDVNPGVALDGTQSQRPMGGAGSGDDDLRSGRPGLPTELLKAEMERRAEAGTLTGVWSHDAASLSAWVKRDDRTKIGAPSSIRTHKDLRDVYRNLIGRRS